MILGPPESLKLSKDFQDASRLLASVNYTNQPVVYQQFLLNFGTHYLTEMRFGSNYQLQIVYEQCYFKQTHRAKATVELIEKLFYKKFSNKDFQET